MRYFSLTTALLLLLLASQAEAQPPRTISFQGILRDSSGAIVPDGKYSITINLYDSLSGGKPLFSESQSATVIRGTFNLIIGSVTPIPRSLGFDRQYFLGIALKDGAELVPRTLFTAAPYAFRAITADSLALPFVASVNLPSAALTISNADSTAIEVAASSGGGAITAENVGSGSAIVARTHARLLNGNSYVNSPAGLRGENDSLGIGVIGKGYVGVVGYSSIANGSGVQGIAGHAGIGVSGSTDSSIGVLGFATAGGAKAVWGEGLNDATGIYGTSMSGNGVNGVSEFGIAVLGTAGRSVGVQGVANEGDGVVGVSTSGPGVYGTSTSGPALLAAGKTGPGIRTSSSAGNGALIVSDTNSPTFTFATTQIENFQSNHEAVWVRNVKASAYPLLKLHVDPAATGNFIEGYAWNGSGAATRKFHILPTGTYVAGSDFAESLPKFDSTLTLRPGDVICIAPGPTLRVQASSVSYDSKVIGVYSTRPGMLGAEKGDGITRIDPGDVPVAIAGIVPTRVSTENGAIKPGDLLVSSNTFGCAMRADTSKTVPGNVLGKALEAYDGLNPGKIKVLVMVR